MEQKQKSKKQEYQKDTTHPRNESTPEQSSVGTSTSKKIDSDNSPEVRDAMNESQL